MIGTETITDPVDMVAGALRFHQHTGDTSALLTVAETLGTLGWRGYMALSAPVWGDLAEGQHLLAGLVEAKKSSGGMVSDLRIQRAFDMALASEHKAVRRKAREVALASGLPCLQELVTEGRG